MQLVLVRHGATVAEPGRCIGHTDVELSDEGRLAMSRLAAEWDTGAIRAPARIVSSDLSRARASAKPFAERFGLPIETDEMYRELSFGRWEGRAWSDIQAADAEAVRAWADAWLAAAPPDGEGVSQLLERVRSALASLGIAEHRGATGSGAILIVSHAGWIRAALSLLLDEPAAAMFERPIDYAHAMILDVDGDGRARALAINVDRIN